MKLKNNFFITDVTKSIFTSIPHEDINNDFRVLKKTIIIASHDQNIIKSAGIIIDLSVKPIPRIGVRKKN